MYDLLIQLVKICTCITEGNETPTKVDLLPPPPSPDPVRAVETDSPAFRQRFGAPPSFFFFSSDFFFMQSQELCPTFLQ
jgi:hypothetical protein